METDLFRGYLEGGDLTRNVSNEVDEFGGGVTMTGPVSQCWAPNNWGGCMAYPY